MQDDRNGRRYVLHYRIDWSADTITMDVYLYEDMSEVSACLKCIGPGSED
jgi:hypothetical protein